MSRVVNAGQVKIELAILRGHLDRGQFRWCRRDVYAARHPWQRFLKNFVGIRVIPVLLGDGLVDEVGIECINVPWKAFRALHPVEGSGLRIYNVVVSVDRTPLREHPVEHVVLIRLAGLGGSERSD